MYVCMYVCMYALCIMHYVEEYAQHLNAMVATHRASMIGKLMSSSRKRLAEHFATGISKHASSYL